jgi:hypothetical protein
MRIRGGLVAECEVAEAFEDGRFTRRALSAFAHYSYSSTHSLLLG